MRGYTRPNLFRMRQFYDAYRGDKKVSPLVRQLPWTHHLVVMGQAKHAEERRFYILAAIKGRWTKRELERQLRAGAALRSDGSGKRVSPAVARTHPAALDELKNAYSLEFLGLSDDHSEADLHGALLRNPGRFINELGRDFCFVGSEYPVQVGSQDFAIDLVFFHRGLCCLVAFELKTEKFKPADPLPRLEPGPFADRVREVGQGPAHAAALHKEPRGAAREDLRPPLRLARKGPVSSATREVGHDPTSESGPRERASLARALEEEEERLRRLAGC